ncbi:hypothetical protein AKO1_005522, partial [Acrasis kona]
MIDVFLQACSRRLLTHYIIKAYNFYCRHRGIPQCDDLFIKVFVECGLIKEAVIVFDGMRVQDPKYEDAYPHIVKGLVSAGQYQRAILVFEKMEQNCPHVINNDVILSVLTACKKTSNTNLAEDLWQRLLLLEIHPSRFHIEIMMERLCSEKELQKAYQLLQTIPASHVTMDILVDILNLCRELGDQDKWVEITKKVTTISNSKIDKNLLVKVLNKGAKYLPYKKTLKTSYAHSKDGKVHVFSNGPNHFDYEHLDNILNDLKSVLKDNDINEEFYNSDVGYALAYSVSQTESQDEPVCIISLHKVNDGTIETLHLISKHMKRRIILREFHFNVPFI